jgi:hypothetical protein
MSCKDCSERGDEIIRWMDPEILGIEPEFDDEGEEIERGPIKLVRYSCNYWDEHKYRTGVKTSMNGLNKGTDSCCRYSLMKNIEITNAVVEINGDWLRDRGVCLKEDRDYELFEIENSLGKGLKKQTERHEKGLKLLNL